MSNHQNKDPQHFASIFKALSNPHRLAIFLRLVRCCEPGTTCAVDEATCVCVGDLGRDLGISPSTVSHHIKELRLAGLIQMERRGQTVQCSVSPQALRDLALFLEELAPSGALLCGYEAESERGD